MMAKSNYLGALAAAAGTLAAVGLLVLMLVVVDTRPAGAASPGQNGKIALDSNRPGAGAKGKGDSYLSAAARIKKFTKSSTVPQSGVIRVGGNAAGARITAVDNPYSFSNTRTIASLKQVTIRVTIFDGDTASGEADENDLLLELDNINTGIALNGFSNLQTVTRTIRGIPNQGRALKKALKADGQLAARIIDADPAEGNSVGIPDNVETTLRIKGTLTR